MDQEKEFGNHGAESGEHTRGEWYAEIVCMVVARALMCPTDLSLHRVPPE